MPRKADKADFIPLVLQVSLPEPMNDALFNFFHLIVLLGAGQGLFIAAILFFLPQGNRLANRILAFFLLFFCLNIGGIALYELRLILHFPHLALLYSSLALLFSPFFYFYVLAMTRPAFRLRLVHLLHGLPFFLFVGIHIPFFLQSAEAKRKWLEESYIATPPLQIVLLFATAIQGLLYLVLCYRRLNHHEHSVKEVYSDAERVSLRWLRMFLLGLVCVFGTCLLFSFFNARLADLFSNLVFSIFTYVMAVYALRQPAIFSSRMTPDELLLAEKEEMETEHASTGKYERSAMPEELVTPAFTRLQEIMEKEKIFRNPELKLTDLADRMALSPHHLSQLLNIHVRENFYDLINRYRVEDFKRALSDPENQHFSLLGLAFDAGFNSKAAFNNAFKKHTGMTPSEWRQNQPV